MLPDFLEDKRFPELISYNAITNLKFNTSITVLPNGFEQRNLNWSDPIREFNVSKNIQDINQKNELMKFYISVRGALIGFRYKDWVDYQTDVSEGVLNENGTTDGNWAELKLYKVYNTFNSLSGVEQVKRIFKPVVNTIKIYKNNVLTNWIVNPDGIVDTLSDTYTITDNLVWSGEFDLPCRFKNDNLSLQISNFNIFDSDNIEIVELRIEE